jgi:enoyl-CoA hydratase/carnithine racemase
MLERIAELCTELSTDNSVRAVVLTGAAHQGRPAFAGGADIAQFREFQTEQDVLDYQALNDRVAHAVEDLAVPTLAAIAGPCVGGGAFLDKRRPEWHGR